MAETEDRIWGINFEGGKIVDHATSSANCLGYTNIQIAMDAPFLGKVAHESSRRSAQGGRAETLFEDYDEQRMTDELASALEEIFRVQSIYDSDPTVMIQIARGNSAVSMENDIIMPILSEIGATRYTIHHGYRTHTYFPIPSNKFLMANIGMYADLTTPQPAGTVNIPNSTYDIKEIEDQFIETVHRDHDDDLLSAIGFGAIQLIGMDDDMLFVTPDNYPNGKQMLDDLINRLEAHET